MRVPRTPLLALGVALGLAAACYVGDLTLGGICESADDCGEGQSCSNSVCGQCGNGTIEPGEFCYGQADENRLGGEVRLIVDGDFDQDGDIDIVAAGNSNCGGVINGPCWSINILDNRGDGTFELSEGNPVAGHIESVELGDFDGNEDIEAAFTLEGAPLLTVVYNIFSTREIVNLPMPGDARSVRQSDVDGDGDVDLLAAADAPGVGEGTVYLFRNDGTGTFGNFEPIQANPTAWLGPMIDLNADGNSDLLVANRSIDQVTVLHGDGTGAFAIDQELATGAQPLYLHVNYLNQDDYLDIAVANTTGSSITIFRGTAQGGFEAGEDLPTGPAPSFITAADVNEDSWPDLLVTNQGDDKLSIYLSRYGEFPDAIEFDVGAAPNWIVHQDFNGDGFKDLTVAAGNDISFSYGDF